MRAINLAVACVAAFASAGHHADEPAHVDCTPAGDTIEMKWNVYASSTGLYEIEGCDGVSPTLHLEAGKEYKFVQKDSTNWFHPVGFAFEPGGAHNVCNGDECPEVEEGLQYFINGQAQTDDESGFGLDAYEPIFFYPKDAWMELCGEDGCHATLTIPSTVTKLYYFCHIHKDMGAEIIVEGADADAKDPMYAHLFQPAPQRSEFDRMCGTWDSEPFTADHATCKDKQFLCGENLDSEFNVCLNAIDCQMHHEMATTTDSNIVATFSRQMIAHHNNAVQMAKLLMIHMKMEDFGGDQEAYEEFSALAHDIVNTQNAQITTMQGWLDGYEAETNSETELCYCLETSRRHLLFSAMPLPGC